MSQPHHPPALALGVVILGAGRSTRMGRRKLLLPWGGTSVIGHLIRQWTMLGAQQVGVVWAAQDESMQAELDRLGLPLANRICNPEPDRGMFSSVQCAATWTGWAPALTHWVLVLGDQPHLSAATLQALLEFATSHPTRICQPARDGRPRHPVLMPRKVFLEIADTLPGRPRAAAANLADFLAAYPVALCNLDDPGLDLDIDRPEDYARALELGSPTR